MKGEEDFCVHDIDFILDKDEHAFGFRVKENINFGNEVTNTGMMHIASIVLGLCDHGDNW